MGKAKRQRAWDELKVSREETDAAIRELDASRISKAIDYERHAWLYYVGVCEEKAKRKRKKARTTPERDMDQVRRDAENAEMVKGVEMAAWQEQWRKGYNAGRADAWRAIAACAEEQ